MAVKKKEKKESKTRYIYLGPYLLKEGVSPGTVFIEKPKILNELKENYPGIERLFVELKDIVKAKADIKQVGSLLHITNEKILKNMKKKIKVEVSK